MSGGREGTDAGLSHSVGAGQTAQQLMRKPSDLRQECPAPASFRPQPLLVADSANARLTG